MMERTIPIHQQGWFDLSQPSVKANRKLLTHQVYSIHLKINILQVTGLGEVAIQATRGLMVDKYENNAHPL